MRAIFVTTLLAVTAVFAAAETIPFELERLNNQRDRKIEEINQIYKKQLESLKVKYTKVGNLDVVIGGYKTRIS
jgi:hypothetical protein